MPRSTASPRGSAWWQADRDDFPLRRTARTLPPSLRMRGERSRRAARSSLGAATPCCSAIACVRRSAVGPQVVQRGGLGVTRKGWTAGSRVPAISSPSTWVRWGAVRDSGGTRTLQSPRGMARQARR